MDHSVLILRLWKKINYLQQLADNQISFLINISVQICSRRDLSRRIFLVNFPVLQNQHWYQVKMEEFLESRRIWICHDEGNKKKTWIWNNVENSMSDTLSRQHTKVT